MTQQPLCSPDRERFLAWNGQLFHWLPSDRADVARADALESRMNDGQALFDSILQKIDAATDGNRSPSGEEVGQALSNALAQVEGPYALVFVDVCHLSPHLHRDVSPMGLIFCFAFARLSPQLAKELELVFRPRSAGPAVVADIPVDAREPSNSHLFGLQRRGTSAGPYF